MNAGLKRLDVSGFLTTLEPGALDGRRNQNPEGVSLGALVREDLATHDRDLTQLGFWVLAVHRFGNWRMEVRPPVLRKALSALYKTAFFAVTTASGIEVPYSTKVGRRVRFWHHGGTVVSARAIGDDVVFRHNTTVGVARNGAGGDAKPLIGHRVDIGVGAAILGEVTVGDDARIGANAVVLCDVGASETAVGVPARVNGAR